MPAAAKCGKQFVIAEKVRELCLRHREADHGVEFILLRAQPVIRRFAKRSCRAFYVDALASGNRVGRLCHIEFGAWRYFRTRSTGSRAEEFPAAYSSAGCAS